MTIEYSDQEPQPINPQAFEEYMKRKEEFLRAYEKGEADCVVENLGFVA